MPRVASRPTVFVDSNVLVCSVDHELPHKRDAARRLLLEHLGVSLALSTQVLLEFFWVSTRKLAHPYPAAAARALARQFLRAHVVVPSPDMVLAAMARSTDSGLSIWDALILQAAESCGAEVLYSEDKHLLAANTEIEVVDPFAGLPERDAD